MNKRKLLQRLLSSAVQNVRFSDFVGVVEGFGFRESRVQGSHHVFVHEDLPELVNLQDVNGEAKPYQIRQFLRLVERYNLMWKE